MKFDDIIDEIGHFGPYQKKLYFLVCLSAIPNALQTMNVVFILAVQNHRCAIPGLPNDTYNSQGPWHDELIEEWVPWDNDENAYSSCELYIGNRTTDLFTNQTTSCSRYVYDKEFFDSTFVSEIDMVCEDKSLKTYANMIFMLGVLFGSLIMGPLADYIGRKKVMLIGVAGNLVLSFALGFVNNYVAFVILRFGIAFFSVGLFLSSFVVGMELVGPDKRTVAGIGIQIAWTVVLLIFALMAYFIRDWNYLQIATALPTISLLSYIFFLPESSRWLINKGRLEEAKAIIEKAARGNRVTLSEKALTLENLENEGAKENISEMFTDRTLLIRTLVIIYNWIVSTLVYYGLSLNVGALSGDIYLNFTLSSLVEAVGYVFCLLLLDRVGRKLLHSFSMLIAGVACLCTMFPVIYGGDDSNWLTVALSLVGKFGASAAFAIIYLYSAELFPTTTRSSGIGICSFTARIGAIAAPYIADLGDQVGGDLGVALPLVVFGGTSAAAGLLVLLLPETNKQILPETVKDAKEFGRKKKSRKNEYSLDDVQDGEGNDNANFHF